MTKKVDKVFFLSKTWALRIYEKEKFWVIKQTRGTIPCVSGSDVSENIKLTKHVNIIRHLRPAILLRCTLYVVRFAS